MLRALRLNPASSAVGLREKMTWERLEGRNDFVSESGRYTMSPSREILVSADREEGAVYGLVVVKLGEFEEIRSPELERLGFEFEEQRYREHGESLMTYGENAPGSKMSVEEMKEKMLRLAEKALLALGGGR